MNILGVRIDNFTKQETLNKVSEFLNSNEQHRIFTPNPEMLVDAQKDEYFRDVLNSGDLNVCDGIGLSLVSRIKRYSGVDLMLDICLLATEQGRSIYLLGSGSDEVVKQTAEELEKQFPNLKIAGHHPGNHLTIQPFNHLTKLDYNQDQNDELLHNIIMTSPDILFVAFGHAKQEKWIQENLQDLPSVKIAMGVGGAFDYISGRIKRAPLFLRQIGLEWLYRLFKQPKRIVRIWKATILFIYLIIKEKILNI